MALENLPIPDHPSPSITSTLGVRIRQDTIYSNQKGEEKKGIRKRAEKVLDKLQEPLRKVLMPEEAVLYITRCLSPIGAIERATLGWHVYLLTAAALVITNRRLLHIPVSRHGSWKKSVRAAFWGDMEEAKVKGWLSSTLEVKYHDGKKETYWGLRREDAKKIKVLLSAVIPASRGESSAAQTIVSVCPNCQSALEAGVYQCRKCSLTFKDETTLLRRALLVPGGGYFYTGHTGLGLMFFIVEGLFLGLIAFSIGVALGLIVLNPEPGGSRSNPADYWIAAAFEALILGIDKAIAIMHCRRLIREYIPIQQ